MRIKNNFLTDGGRAQKRRILVKKPVEYYPKFSARGQLHYLLSRTNSANREQQHFLVLFYI